LFARETAGATQDADLVATVDRLCVRLATGLSRWFGSYGSAALVTRAMARARTEHPALEFVTLRPDQSPLIAGLADGAERYGATAVREGFIAMLEALAEAISRLIGEDLTTQLLEQSIAAPSVGEVHQTEGKKP
jgi:hypothetical protein